MLLFCVQASRWRCPEKSVRSDIWTMAPSVEIQSEPCCQARNSTSERTRLHEVNFRHFSVPVAWTLESWPFLCPLHHPQLPQNYIQHQRTEQSAVQRAAQTQLRNQKARSDLYLKSACHLQFDLVAFVRPPSSHHSAWYSSRFFQPEHIFTGLRSNPTLALSE